MGVGAAPVGVAGGHPGVEAHVEAGAEEDLLGDGRGFVPEVLVGSGEVAGEMLLGPEEQHHFRDARVGAGLGQFGRRGRDRVRAFVRMDLEPQVVPGTHAVGLLAVSSRANAPSSN
ncbi:hypothetical protein [Streptomyces sp. NBC_01264]|uniref:hypothetical protein n=1 Tax=Streptomyces sp. NBC_01264 TaxID=2903804 RepID=UPI00224ECD9F|nr:hypothetical protein [Streptomyces sp. NBC_01264]MCX4782002.1 hypothetical protein [Streptomyces sp. NBC_01264]